MHQQLGPLRKTLVDRSYVITHTADTALATVAAGGSQIGATTSNAIIPTSGIIRLTLLEGEFDETGSAAAGTVGIAVDVGGTKVFSISDDDSGTSRESPRINISTGVGSRLVGDGANAGTQAVLIASFDIVANGFPIGSRDIQVYFGDEAAGSTGAVTLTGTTVTCRVLIEIVDTA